MPEELDATTGASLRLGELVVWERQVYRLVGIDPSGVQPQRAYLKDPATGEQRAVALATVARVDGDAESYSPDR